MAANANTWANAVGESPAMVVEELVNLPQPLASSSSYNPSRFVHAQMFHVRQVGRDICFVCEVCIGVSTPFGLNGGIVLGGALVGLDDPPRLCVA